jgi:hypothetical protein
MMQAVANLNKVLQIESNYGKNFKVASLFKNSLESVKSDLLVALAIAKLN